MDYRPYVSGMLYPQIKLARARIHLDYLRALLARARNVEEAYTITKYDDAERGTHHVKVCLNRMDPMVPITLGEFAYQVRTALDQLAWQLGLLSGRKPSGKSAFPMQAFDRIEDRQGFQLATWDIPCEAITLIKGFQPHQRGQAYKTHPLWKLHKLNNLDKHQTIGYNCTELRVNVNIRADRKILDDEFGVLLTVPIAMKEHLQVEPLPPELIFGQPMEVTHPQGRKDAFTLTEEEIAEIHRFVNDEVLPVFERFFPNCETLASITEKGTT